MTAGTRDDRQTTSLDLACYMIVHRDGKTFLLIVGDFGEDYEIMVPFQALQAVGPEVDAACPEWEAGEVVKTAVHDFELTATFDDVDPADYDGLVLPGGRAPEYLRAHEAVLSVVRAFAADDMAIAAICHAGQILAGADVISGRTCTSCPALEHDVREAGGEWAEGVAVDGNLVTAQAWPGHPERLSAFLGVPGTQVDHAAPQAADD